MAEREGLAAARAARLRRGLGPAHLRSPRSLRRTQGSHPSAFPRPVLHQQPKIEKRKSKIQMAEREGLATACAAPLRGNLRSAHLRFAPSNPGSHPSLDGPPAVVVPSSFVNRNAKMKMAEREGFEPPGPLRAQRFSRPPQSTTLPPLQVRVVREFDRRSRCRGFLGLTPPCFTGQQLGLGFERVDSWRTRHRGQPSPFSSQTTDP